MFLTMYLRPYSLISYISIKNDFILPSLQLLNQIVCEFPPEHPLSSSRPLRDSLGHTPIQVCCPPCWLLFQITNLFLLQAFSFLPTTKLVFFSLLLTQPQLMDLILFMHKHQMTQRSLGLNLYRLWQVACWDAS